MKKVLFLFLLLIPFIAKAEVKITNVELVDNTEDLEAEKNPHFEGLQLDINLKLSEVGEYAKYKLTIKNDTKKDYEINMGEDFSAKEYVKYEFSQNGTENTILKANESKDIYVLVKYNKEVPANEFVNGVYKDDNVMTLNLSNEEQQESPDTKTGYAILIVATILFISLLLVLLNKYKLEHLMVLVIAIAIAIPVTIFALEKITIKVQAKIQIVYVKPEFCVAEYDDSIAAEPVLLKKDNYDYVKGTTWSEYIESNLNTYGFGPLQRMPEYVTLSPGNYCGFVLTYNNERVKLTDKINSKKDVCYEYHNGIC